MQTIRETAIRETLSRPLETTALAALQLRNCVSVYQSTQSIHHCQRGRVIGVAFVDHTQEIGSPTRLTDWVETIATLPKGMSGLWNSIFQFETGTNTHAYLIFSVFCLSHSCSVSGNSLGNSLLPLWAYIHSHLNAFPLLYSHYCHCGAYIHSHFAAHGHNLSFAFFWIISKESIALRLCFLNLLSLIWCPTLICAIFACALILACAHSSEIILD